MVGGRGAGGTEKYSIGVDDLKLIPYKQHPSAVLTDEEPPESNGSEARSVSENWIASESRKDVMFVVGSLSVSSGETTKCECK
jgi:hypothetical protein